jgi:hypothetical protein
VGLGHGVLSGLAEWEWRKAKAAKHEQQYERAKHPSTSRITSGLPEISAVHCGGNFPTAF